MQSDTPLCHLCTDDIEASQPFLELFRQHMQRSCASAANDDESSAVAGLASKCAADLAHKAGHMQHEDLCRLHSRAQRQATAQARGINDVDVSRPATHALDVAWQVRHVPVLASLITSHTGVCIH